MNVRVTWQAWFWAAAVLLLAALWLAGLMQPWILPDTPGYLAPPGCPDCLAGPRTPLYGWLVQLGGGEAFFRAIPWLQTAGFILAGASLMRALHRAGLSPAACLAAGLVVLGCNELLLWARAVLPEAPANAAAIAAVAATIDGATGWHTARSLARATFWLALAYLMRPSFLPLVVALPALLALLRRRQKRPASPAIWLLGAGLVPFLAIAGVRQATLGDFNIVSFGGFQMSGMAALMLTPDTVPRLPPDLQPMAEDILHRREALVAAGDALPVPRNSSGVASFFSAATGYFDILARTHDAVLYDAVAHTRGDGESWVAFNARAQRFALAVLRAEKLSYAAWVVGATIRLTGRMLVANLAFVAWFAVLAGCFLWRCLRGAASLPAPPEGEVGTLVLVTGAYTLASAILVVTVTFPAERYVDSAGILVSLWPAYGVLRLTRLVSLSPIGKRAARC